ncbi:unnamed protein product [Protopolystoma xenopodis]|uniref:Trafficking protein particle complex subunit 2-like protein n=1 Tax=Protopolystoma xenopodis TaxID=117903 RepID=A0A3S4ZTH0_9PLAT|nr:unnamed protein product [Protopolystoma xenopodis]
MAVCIAVISNSNRPLYLKTSPCADPLFYHFKVHAALDVIEEKMGKFGSISRGSHNRENAEQYLGLLYPTEDHRLYGYVTNTRTKFVIVQEVRAPVTNPPSVSASPRSASPIPIASSNSMNSSLQSTGATGFTSAGVTGIFTVHRDNEVRTMFQKLHTAYVELVSSPFYTPGSQILPESGLAAAKRFEILVDSLLTEVAQPTPYGSSSLSMLSPIIGEADSNQQLVV